MDLIKLLALETKTVKAGETHTVTTPVTRLPNCGFLQIIQQKGRHTQ